MSAASYIRPVTAPLLRIPRRLRRPLPIPFNKGVLRTRSRFKISQIDSSIDIGSEDDMEQRHGVLRSWHEDRGFGIVVGWSHLDRYFLHLTNILEGTVPPLVGSAVDFDVAQPRKDGQLPQAINAIVKPAVGVIQ